MTLLALFSVEVGAVPPVQLLPSVREVQLKALDVAGLEKNVASSWEREVSWKAALPELRLAVQRDLDENLKLTNEDNISISGGEVLIGPREQDITRDFDAGTRVQVTAVWSLDELVFNQDKVLVSQERRRRNEERQRLLDDVTRLYFDRLRAEEELISRKSMPEDRRTALRLLVKEKTAGLDALTDGWFSRYFRGDDRR